MKRLIDNILLKKLGKYANFVRIWSCQMPEAKTQPVKPANKIELLLRYSILLVDTVEQPMDVDYAWRIKGRVRFTRHPGAAHLLVYYDQEANTTYVVFGISFWRVWTLLKDIEIIIE